MDCHYPDGMEQSVLALIGSIVQAIGLGSARGKRGHVEIESIEGIRSPSPPLDLRTAGAGSVADHLMLRQSLNSPQPLERFILDLTPAEAEAFDAALEEMN